MEAAILVLGVTAVGGIVIAGMRLIGIPRPPTWMAIGHGAIGATGLGLLIYAAVTTTLPTMGLVALAVLILAALGGSMMFVGYHLREMPLPIGLMIIHGLAALTGLGLLAYAQYGTGS